jgi:hypothetical protein
MDIVCYLPLHLREKCISTYTVRCFKFTGLIGIIGAPYSYSIARPITLQASLLFPSVYMPSTYVFYDRIKINISRVVADGEMLTTSKRISKSTVDQKGRKDKIASRGYSMWLQCFILSEFLPHEINVLIAQYAHGAK